ncbi:MAG: DUF4855 domain-containing protein [Bacteroidales bacterium]|nr:DUF4855 domain-containing protein [Bacteroidales bacterium]
MINSRQVVFAAFFLLLACCGKKEGPATPAIPAIRATMGEVTAFDAKFSVQAVQCSGVNYGVSEDMTLSEKTGSTGPVSLQLQVTGLQPLTSYILYVQGIGPKGEKGKVVTLEFSTGAGPQGLYPWEMSRTGVPTFADLSLITMGWHNSNPPAWTQERFSSHVQYDGKWIFDAFLCIDGYNSARRQSYSLANGRESAGKDAWEDLLDAWLGEGGALVQLDAAIAEAGTPPSPRLIVMSIPDPTRYQYFSDRSSSTTYWGDGLDFSRTQDQILACRWYMDRCRALFNERKYRHLELAGFYILSEELPLNPAFFEDAGESYDPSADTWNWQHKNWEILVPEASRYAHSCREGLWWVPYHLAPGYKVWRRLGFDNIFMQPNYYWDHGSISHPLSDTKQAIREYRMGVELEFEYSLVASVMADGRSGPDGNGTPTFYAADVPLLRSRVREYMQMYKDSGMYGTLPLAVYSGTDAWHQLASSKDEGDVQMFRDICNFITESPLKNK